MGGYRRYLPDHRFPHMAEELPHSSGPDDSIILSPDALALLNDCPTTISFTNPIPLPSRSPSPEPFKEPANSQIEAFSPSARTSSAFDLPTNRHNTATANAFTTNSVPTAPLSTFYTPPPPPQQTAVSALSASAATSSATTAQTQQSSAVQQQQFICCGTTHANRSAYSLHRKQRHDERGPTDKLCPHCNKWIARGSMARHLRDVHKL
ncbi:hypothetical protein DL98DRAFT_539503 [Cadophora sp. DSE1049]|nr:hypothetical protein DL98DRAFT_539503 [Cadophora sp. DSE1049]